MMSMELVDQQEFEALEALLCSVEQRTGCKRHAEPLAPDLRQQLQQEPAAQPRSSKAPYTATVCGVGAAPCYQQQQQQQQVPTCQRPLQLPQQQPHKQQQQSLPLPPLHQQQKEMHMAQPMYAMVQRQQPLTTPQAQYSMPPGLQQQRPHNQQQQQQRWRPGAAAYPAAAADRAGAAATAAGMPAEITRDGGGGAAAAAVGAAGAGAAAIGPLPEPGLALAQQAARRQLPSSLSKGGRCWGGSGGGGSGCGGSGGSAAGSGDRGSSAAGSGGRGSGGGCSSGPGGSGSKQQRQGQPGAGQLVPAWQVGGGRSLPKLPWAGKVLYAATPADVDAACRRLLAAGPPGAVGFDLEWKPSFVKGSPPNKVALVQLAYATQGGTDWRPHVSSHSRGVVVLLLQIAHSGVTAKLQEVLCDDQILKVGVNIGGDVLKLAADFGVQTCGVLDLSDAAHSRQLRAVEGVTAHIQVKRWSLAGLVEEVLDLDLPKPNDIRLGNWERRPLSPEQQRYAAMDAYACLLLHWELQALPTAQTLSQQLIKAMRQRAAAGADNTQPAGADDC